MIFFGTSKERVSGTELIQDEVCSNCNTENSMYVTALIKYAHLYWIPLIPAGKRIVPFCTNCKANSTTRSLSSQGEAFCKEFEENQTYPLSYWSLALILLAIGGFMFLSFLYHTLVRMF